MDGRPLREVGILYESDEWSDWKLHAELEMALGRSVRMIDMEATDCLERACACDVLVSRVFASAGFRGHAHAAAAMNELTSTLPAGIELVNPARAHGFETSKARTASALAAAEIATPAVRALGRPDELAHLADDWSYPIVIKPDCGGRSTHTAVIRDADEARCFLADAPEIAFVVEDFIDAGAGYLTRVELVDGRVTLVVKRSIAASGLSSYHEGSTYEPYPDCPDAVHGAVLAAAEVTGIRFGSFDVIEDADGCPWVIDANSVSNVSEDCTELFGGFDLMREYARALARRIDGK